MITLLEGEWQGFGRGFFPTIEAFSYRETTRFVSRADDDTSLHYEQRTWVLGPDGAEEPSHWESGFVQVVDTDGDITLDLLNAQNSGRVEVLRGVPEVRDHGFHCSLHSLVHAHDARMRSTTRTLLLEAETLRYTCAMSTTAVPQASPHLEATLRRVLRN